ncbi:hypothetical protein SLA2020_465930 [Shorea laevis]
MQERVFHFSKENISKLKAKANAEVGTSNISSLQALLCHIWLSVMRIKHLDPDAEVNYQLPVGIRQRLDSVPEEYFGNTVQGGIVIVKVRELLEPITARSGASNKAAGLLTMHRRVNEGDIDVEACLSSDTLEVLANDYDFMNAVTTIENRKSENGKVLV